MLRQNGVYLITGGLGRIGLTFAEHLAVRVQARLVLVKTGNPSGRGISAADIQRALEWVIKNKERFDIDTYYTWWVADNASTRLYLKPKGEATVPAAEV